jgi:OCT family organic cation transporter-like MFS transporter 4/5
MQYRKCASIPQPERVSLLNVLISDGIDKALALVGDKNRYQVILISMLSFTWVLSAFILMIQPFLTQLPIFLCTDENGNVYNCSENNGGCEAQILSPSSPNSLVVEFGLYCDQAYLRSFGGTIFFAGGSVGCLVLMTFADTYGRKLVLLFTYVIGSVAILLLGILADSYVGYFIFVAICWFGFDPYFALCTIILNEQGGNIMRKYSSPVLLSAWALGELIFVGFAYYIPAWRDLCIYVIGVPLLVTTVIFFWVYESARYYSSRNKFMESADILRKISNFNKQDELLMDREEDVKQLSILTRAMHLTQEKDKSIIDLFRSTVTRNRTIFLSLLMFYLYLAYNAVLLGLATVGNDIYMNSVLVSLAELAAYLSSNTITSKLKRKKALYLFLTIGSIFCMAFLPFSSQSDDADGGTSGLIQALLTLVVKFCVCIGFGMIYIFASELFPTELRSVGVGVCIFVGRFGSMLAPFILQWSEAIDIHHMVIYGVLGFLTLIPVYYLPETYGTKLEDKISSFIGKTDTYKNVDSANRVESMPSSE